jgi:hypothetical protein
MEGLGAADETLRAEAGVTVKFCGKVVLTWCRNGNTDSREFFGEGETEPLGPAITEGDAEGMMSIGR